MFFNIVRKGIVVAVTAAIFSFCSLSFAEQATGATSLDQATVDKITHKMSTLKVKVISASASPVSGLYELITDRGIVYLSTNLQFIINGNIYDLDNNMANISDSSFAKLRKSRLKDFEKEMIVYKAAHEKHVITVFTDTTCVYCKKLHRDMDEYNKLGITVRYLAFPRAGGKSATAKSMASIWCSDDKKAAMDDVKKGRKIPAASAKCEDMINKQYELGQFFGVKGTPSIILEDGSLTPGYVPAKQLAQMLDQKFN